MLETSALHLLRCAEPLFTGSAGLSHESRPTAGSAMSLQEKLLKLSAVATLYGSHIKETILASLRLQSDLNLRGKLLGMRRSHPRLPNIRSTQRLPHSLRFFSTASDGVTLHA
eukprot:108345-Amphidinium_carterae.1